jgi:hypothetical protein
MSAFMNAVQGFIDEIKGEQGWVEELNRHSQNIAQHFGAASLEETNLALRRFAALFPKVPLVALGQVAINCGSLVERGGDPDIAGPGLLGRLPRINETVGDFCSRCRALALADAPLIDELRAATVAESDDTEKTDDRTPSEILEDHVRNEGWQQLAARYGSMLFEEHPYSVLGHMSDHFFRLGLIAHLSRSKSLRAAARSRPELLEGTLVCDQVAGSHRSFLATILQVLDNEPLVVLHVAQKKGFDVRVSGISDNFQLHTLLAGAIIGSPDAGWVDGEAPSPRAVAECRDARTSEDGGDNVTGAFNLCNWTALRTDGSLPEGQGVEVAAHWIWNEGWPAEIVPFEGRRIVLLGRSPYIRNWRAGRQFDGMAGELIVDRMLDTAEVHDWLHRLSTAAKQ